MISVEEALEKILSYVRVLPEEERPILDCLGQVLSEDIYSPLNVPPLDNSAMDGYAVRSTDTRGASRQSPRLLRVIDTVAAGSISRHEVTPGTAIRIMTGAPLPKGADSVVRFEDTDEAQRKGRVTEVGVLRQIKAGADIRQAAEDIVKGSLVLKQGTIIRPSEIGVLASLGRSTVKVTRRPVVAVLATGNELVDINQPLPPGKIYNSNTYSIAAQVKRYGGTPQSPGYSPG
jgi:molybdopterin molybdotransferase